ADMSRRYSRDVRRRTSAVATPGRRKHDYSSGGGSNVITLVGVGHVFDIGAAIRRTIVGLKPAVVGVELDPARFAALRAPEANPPALSVTGVLAYVQRRIAREYGTQVGAEMMAAAEAARDMGALLAFLDLDSRAVLARLMRAMTLGERARFVVSVIAGLFLRRSTVERELERFE